MTVALHVVATRLHWPPGCTDGLKGTQDGLGSSRYTRDTGENEITPLTTPIECAITSAISLDNDVDADRASGHAVGACDTVDSGAAL